MLPNSLPKVRNIARTFAADRDFRAQWSKFIYGLGKNGSGSRHFTAVANVTGIYSYPGSITDLTKVRYEVELILIHNAPNASYMVFAVEEYNGNSNGGTPHFQYVASFKVPVSFDLSAIQRSHFEKPAIDDTDETFAIDAGMGSSLIVLSKQGLQKLDEFTPPQP